MLSADGALVPGVVSDDADEEDSFVYLLKPAAKATVYYNDSGKTYHMTTKCGKMRTAVEHVLGDAANTRHQRCTLCETPDKSILDEVYVAWLDESNIVHMSDECSAFDGVWVLQTAAQANEDGRTGCSACGADAYLDALAEGIEIQVMDPAEIVVAEAAAEAGVTVEDGLVTPSHPLKSAAEAIVYHSSNGKWYHTYNRCSGMTGGNAYKLEDCIGSFKTCSKCGAPSGDLIGQPCLWQDEKGLCHTSDECSHFSGKYTLIPRDEALGQKLSGCFACGADEYLVEGTSINYLEIASVG